jgi:pyruvate/oxaloacetate carboxyltransferase
MNLYEEYSLLEAKLAEIELQKEGLRGKILEQMIETGAKKIDTAMGSFTKTTSKKWTYTNKVKELEEEYKAQKVKEQENDIATFVETPTFRYSAIKL